MAHHFRDSYRHLEPRELREHYQHLGEHAGIAMPVLLLEPVNRDHCVVNTGEHLEGGPCEEYDGMSTVGNTIKVISVSTLHSDRRAGLEMMPEA